MRHHAALPKSHVIYTIAVLGFVYTIHYVLPAYYNSSFLSLFLSPQNVGLTFMLGSAVSVLGFLFVPALIRKAGNYTVALWLIIIDAFLMYGLVALTDPRALAIVFAIQMAVVALIGFCMDIFLEVYTASKNVGAVRGMYLTSINSAWLISPFIGSLIINGTDDYRSVYLAGLLILLPLFYLIFKNFPHFKDPHYQHPSLFQTFKHIFKNPNHSRLFFINTILQTFYAWMTVYMAIYLHMVVGFSWSEIGIILTIMLLPFVLIELPLGRLADKKYGEKEIMMLGFALLGLATVALGFLTTKNIWIWAFALFVTRIGAAAVEIMIETYFFKTTPAKDPSLLGFFRVTRFISFFIAPLITGAVYLFTQNQSYLFVTLGIICLVPVALAAGIKDTK
jgi:MFS family permease